MQVKSTHSVKSGTAIPALCFTTCSTILSSRINLTTYHTLSCSRMINANGPISCLEIMLGDTWYASSFICATVPN